MTRDWTKDALERKHQADREYYAKHRDEIRKKASSDENKLRQRIRAETQRREEGAKTRAEWIKSVKVAEAVKKERKAAYERLRYLENKEKILEQQRQYYYKTHEGSGPKTTLSRDEILYRKRIREEKKRREAGIKPRSKMSQDEYRAKKREYMKKRYKKLKEDKE